MDTIATKQENDRIVWLDIAKVLAVFAVIIVHTVSLDSLSRKIIISFPIQLFFIVSGYTIKPSDTFRLELKRIAQDARRLLLPLLAVVALEALIQIFSSAQSAAESLRQAAEKLLWGNGGPYSFFGRDMAGIGVVWFLVTLFFSKLLYRLLLKLFPKAYYRIPAVLLVTAAGVIIGRHIWLPQNLDIVLASMVFMEAGHIGKSLTLKKWQDALAFALALAIWMYCVLRHGIFMEYAVRLYPYGAVSFLSALCACFCIVYLSRLIAAVKLFRPLAFLGRHSLLLLLVHSLDSMYIWRVFSGISGATVVFGLVRALADSLVVCLLLALWWLASKLFGKRELSAPNGA